MTRTEAVQRFSKACSRHDAVNHLRANGCYIAITSKTYKDGLWAINADITHALQSYLPQITEALSKQIGEEVAEAWRDVQETVRGESAVLKVIK